MIVAVIEGREEGGETRRRGREEWGRREEKKGEREWCLGKVPNISTYVINISFGRNFL